FNEATSVETQVRELFDETFSKTFSDSISNTVFNDLSAVGHTIIDELYHFGVLSEVYDFPENRAVVILEERVKKHSTTFSNLVQQDEIKPIIEKTLSENDFEAYTNVFVSLFFDLVQPNLTYDESFTEKALKDDLDNISYSRGSIEKQTLIISKGEIIDGQKYQLLTSLKSEYESQVWSKSNYNWILFAYILLVSLALLMLLLFLRKYRLDIFENNTKVTFIFFNIFLMVLLTTMVVNYDAKYTYIIPICILPLVLKAFFDARLGMFAHVITVLLLGSIVPNSYEYMFLQIIAGIVTILTVSELYKRANLFISVGQITLIYIIAYFAFFVIHEGSIETINWETFIWFILCGLATLFVQPLIYVYEKIFGL